jgi:hypothetical protein
VNAGIASAVAPLALYHGELDLQTGAISPVGVTVRSRKPGLTKATDLMTEHDPPPAAHPPRSRSPALAAEEARRPALALLDRLFAADAITLEELSNGRKAILGGRLDDILVPVPHAEAPPPVERSIGDCLREQGVLR